MHILVTGGAGFIGSHFVEFVVTQTPHTVTTLDALTYAGSQDNLESIFNDPDHTFVESDIRDYDVVEDVVNNSDIVVNFAAESHVDKSINGATSFVRTNIEGTQTLLQAATESNIKLFVQISTDEVYGQIIEGEFSENDSLHPRNPYAATKAGADMLVNSYSVTHDLPINIVRPSNNYGPRQHPEKFIPKIIRRAINNEPIPVYGNGENIREWTFVEDNIKAIWTIIQKGTVGEIYNVGSGVEMKNINLVKTILNKVGRSTDLINFVQDRPGHDQRYALNAQKVESLGWSPQFSFEDGINKTIQHFSK